MQPTATNRTLLSDFGLFMAFGVITLVLEIFTLSIFPGNHWFPFIIRLVISLAFLSLAFYINYKFSRRNKFNYDLLVFKPRKIMQYLGGVLLACVLLFTLWLVIYFVYPFKIITNPQANVNFEAVVVSYGLGNTLEELLFRSFLLLAAIKLFRSVGGILFVSLLFGLFHLQGTASVGGGLSMVITTFTMSLLFIAVIFYTNSIWAGVMTHITGNIILHTLGFDGTSNGLYQVKFMGSDVNGYVITLIFEMVVIVFALVIFAAERTKRNLRNSV